MEEKVDFAYALFEKEVPVDTIFSQNEMIDTIAITRGRGTEGVVTRWGVTRLPRKTHRGLRKVCAVALRSADLKVWGHTSKSQQSMPQRVSASIHSGGCAHLTAAVAACRLLDTPCYDEPCEQCCACFRWPALARGIRPACRGRSLAPGSTASTTGRR